MAGASSDLDFPTRLDEAGDPFAPLRAASNDRPFVVAQIGQSLDGRIATVSGESRGISGPAALDHLHRLRAHVDAVVVGAGTIAADDPQLNVRRIVGRSPARVAIDPGGRLDKTGKWLTEDGARRILISAAPTKAGPGVERIELPLAGRTLRAARHCRGAVRAGVTPHIDRGRRAHAGRFHRGGLRRSAACSGRAGHHRLGPRGARPRAHPGAGAGASPARKRSYFGRRRRVVRLRFFGRRGAAIRS